MRKNITLALIASAAVLMAQTTTTTREVSTTTTTIVTEKEQTIVVTERNEWQPLRIIVSDFAMVETIGQKRFLSEDNQPIIIPPQCTLNDADRSSVNAFMQGVVRAIDAFDNAKTNSANRAAQVSDNAFERQKALELYNLTVNGEIRSLLLGAEYLAAYLGRNSDVFQTIDSAVAQAAMAKIGAASDFPQDAPLSLARATGATHLITGVVSDLRTQKTSFSGYGIETKTTRYELDVILRVVDLRAQQSVFSNIYTGKTSVSSFSNTLSSGIYQKLMKSALEQAADELYGLCRPGPNAKIVVTPLPPEPEAEKPEAEAPAVEPAVESAAESAAAQPAAEPEVENADAAAAVSEEENSDSTGDDADE